MRPWINPWLFAPRWGLAQRDIIKGMEARMATKEQLDKLRVDIANLITAAVDEIKAAVEVAQKAPVEQADAAIDELDTQVQDTTKKLTDAAAALRSPPTA